MKICNVMKIPSNNSGFWGFNRTYMRLSYTHVKKNRAGPVREQLHKTLTRIIPEVSPGLDFGKAYSVSRKPIAYALKKYSGKFRPVLATPLKFSPGGKI